MNAIVVRQPCACILHLACSMSQPHHPHSQDLNLCCGGRCGLGFVICIETSSRSIHSSSLCRVPVPRLIKVRLETVCLAKTVITQTHPTIHGDHFSACCNDDILHTRQYLLRTPKPLVKRPSQQPPCQPSSVHIATPSPSVSPALRNRCKNSSPTVELRSTFQLYYCSLLFHSSDSFIDYRPFSDGSSLVLDTL